MIQRPTSARGPILSAMRNTIVILLFVSASALAYAQPRDQFRGPWVVTEDSTVAMMVEDTTQRTVLMYGDTIYVHTRETAEIYVAKINEVDYYVPSSVLVLPSRFIPKITTKKAGGPPPRRDVTLRVGGSAGTSFPLNTYWQVDNGFSYAFNVDVAISGANVYATASYEMVQFTYVKYSDWFDELEPGYSWTEVWSYPMASIGLHVGLFAQPVDLVPFIHPIAGWVFQEHDPFFVAGVGLGADYYITRAIVVTAELAPYMKFDRWGRDWWALPIRAGVKVAL